MRTDASGGSAAPATSSRTGGRIPGTPATGLARARKAKTTTGAAHPRSVAPVNGAVRPHRRGPARIAGVVRRVRRTTHHPHVWPRRRPAARAPRAIRSRCPVGPGKRPREGRGCGDGGASAAHGRPPPRGCGDGARVRLPRDHPHVVLRRDPPVVLRCSPHVVLRCDPHVVLGCDPHVVLRRGPRLVVRCGGWCSASPVRRGCSSTFMRLLQTCRARSRPGQCASSSPTRTRVGSGPPGP
jgi:hypothetical protein